MLRPITLKFCVIEPTQPGCRVYFEDGVFCDAHAHPDDFHYRVVSHRLGYGDDVLAYCRMHEFAHCFLEERLHDRPSLALRAVAERKMLSGRASAYEEIAAQAFQRWLHANERPILSGVDWDALKRDALSLLNEAGA